MTNFKKATFKALAEDNGGKVIAKERVGYEFTAFAVDGNIYKMHVAKNSNGSWSIIDPMTGREICGGETREKAVKAVADPKTVMYFSNMVKTDKYKNDIDRFIDLCAAAEPKPRRAAKPKAKTTRKSAPKKKAPAKKQDELAKALAELEAVKKELAEVKASKEKKVEDAATKWTIESVRKWAVPRGFVAEQVNPDRKDCIWVYGVRKDDKATQKELTSMGFRWGKKGWYVDPKRG